MANTQLNRVYVQTIDSTGTTDPTLSLGTKTLTTTVKIGGLGTGGNSINVSSTGINMSGLLNAPNASVGALMVNGATNLNTLGVTGLSTLGNVSVNGTLRVAGQTTLINVSTTTLSATSLSATTLSVLNNVSVGGNVSVQGSVFVSTQTITGDLQVGGTTTATNASVNGTATIDGTTTLRVLQVNGATTFSNSVTTNSTFNANSDTTIVATTKINDTGSSTTSIGNAGSITTVKGPLFASGGLTSTAGTTSLGTTTTGGLTSNSLTVNGAGATSLTGTLGVTGLTTLSGGLASTAGTTGLGATTTGSLGATGTTTINTTGTATTTIGNSGAATTVGGTLAVTGITTLGNVSVTGTLAALGNCSLNNVSIAGNTTHTGYLAVTGGTTLGTTGTGALTVTGDETISGKVIFGTGASNAGNIFPSVVSSTDRRLFINPNTTNTSSAGMMELSSQYGLYNIPYGSNFNLRGCNADGTSNTNYILTATDSTLASTITDPPGSYGYVNDTYLAKKGFNSPADPTSLAAGEYSFSTGTATFYGYLNTNIRIAKGLTYRFIFTVLAVSAGTSINLSIDSANINDLGLIGSSYKTYTLYFTASLSGTLLLSIYGTGNVSRQINFKFISVQPVYDVTIEKTTKMSGLNVTGALGVGTAPNDLLTVYGKRACISINNSSGSGLGIATGGTSVLGFNYGGGYDAENFPDSQTMSGTSFGARIKAVQNGLYGSRSDLYFQHKEKDEWIGDTTGNYITSVFMKHNGLVGIGTTTPEYALMVMNHNNESSTASLVGRSTLSGALINSASTVIYFNINSTTFRNTTVDGSDDGSDWPLVAKISIYSGGSIVTTGSFIAVSDRRIKTNIVDVDDDQALIQLRLLKPKRYQYKDFIGKGSATVYGFIAQEVRETLDYATDIISDTIPNIYESATFLGDTLTLTFNTADLARDASGSLFTKLKIKTRELKDEFVNIVEVIDAHTIKVDKDLTEWGGQLDASGQLVPGNRVFVYGQKVDDFHTLNKDAIWTVATAALQEVDRQLQAEKQKVSDLQSALTIETQKTTQLETTLASVLARLDALEQRTA